MLGAAFSLGKNLMSEGIFMPSICVKNAQVSVRFRPAANSKTKLPVGYRWIGECLGQTSQIVANPNVDKSSSSNGGKQSQSNAGPKAIIIEPSRELAEQTLRCISDFKKHLPSPIKEQLIILGVNAKDQLDQLRNGVDIIGKANDSFRSLLRLSSEAGFLTLSLSSVVATPHRLDGLIKDGHISLANCSFFIIDEIDALLAQGNMKLLSDLQVKMPKMFSDGRRLQLIVCSATLHNFEVKTTSRPGWT